MVLAALAIAVQAGSCGGALASPPARLEAPALRGPVLALAAFGDDLLVLEPEGPSLYRRDGARLELLVRRAVPNEGPPVRRPGGLLRAEAGARSAWALASGWPRALLLDLDDGLGVRAEAAALPWPGAPEGVRLRPGTDLVEAAVAGLDSKTFLALSTDGRHALDADARLLGPGGAAAVELGPPLAAVGSGWLAAGTRAAPGDDDALVLVALEPDPRIRARCPLPGSLRAIAVEASPAAAARVLLAVENAAGAWTLWEALLGERR